MKNIKKLQVRIEYIAYKTILFYQKGINSILLLILRFAQEINKINLEFRTAKFEYFFEVICITVKNTERNGTTIMIIRKTRITIKSK